MKSKTSIPYWLGAWEEGVLVFSDNTVIYLDGDMKVAGRLALEPRKSGEITPVLEPRGFAALGGQGYWLEPQDLTLNLEEAAIPVWRTGRLGSSRIEDRAVRQQIFLC